MGEEGAQYEVYLNLMALNLMKIVTQFDMSTIINPFALLDFIKLFLYLKSTWFHFELNLSEFSGFLSKKSLQKEKGSHKLF